MADRPLEVCKYCGKLIKRRGVQTQPHERDPETGTVTLYREVPAEVWVRTLTGDSMCWEAESPNPPWVLGHAPR